MRTFLPVRSTARNRATVRPEPTFSGVTSGKRRRVRPAEPRVPSRPCCPERTPERAASWWSPAADGSPAAFSRSGKAASELIVFVFAIGSHPETGWLFCRLSFLHGKAGQGPSGFPREGSSGRCLSAGQRTCSVRGKVKGRGREKRPAAPVQKAQDPFPRRRPDRFSGPAGKERLTATVPDVPCVPGVARRSERRRRAVSSGRKPACMKRNAGTRIPVSVPAGSFGALRLCRKGKCAVRITCLRSVRGGRSGSLRGDGESAIQSGF